MVKEMKEEVTKELDSINSGPVIVPTDAKKSETALTSALSNLPVLGEEKDKVLVETVSIILDSIERKGLKGSFNEDSVYYKVLINLQKSNFTQFAISSYGISNPYKLKGRERTVVVVERIKQELENSEIYVSQVLSKNLMVYKDGYWQLIDEQEFKLFLADAMITLGYGFEEATHYITKDELLTQFKDGCPLLKAPESGSILINVKNGTIIISDDSVELRDFHKEDYLTYQLPFDYDPKSECRKFQEFLDQVLPEKESQMILAEFFGSAFIDNKKLKLEKALLLYGTGSNGKSVIFEIIRNLFGYENFSAYSLESITDNTGYTRAKLDGKLLNYASEISGDVNAGKFKQLVSGESIEVRLPYKEPYTMDKIPKLVFNINSFPKNIEKTDAFFRRLITIPFLNRIPDDMQDKALADKISRSELSGILNWVLLGMKRLKSQQSFTDSANVKKLLGDFTLESDSVASFLFESNFAPSDSDKILLKGLFDQFDNYCKSNGFKRPSIQTFSGRLRHLGYLLEKERKGVVVFIKKCDEGDDE